MCIHEKESANKVNLFIYILIKKFFFGTIAMSNMVCEILETVYKTQSSHGRLILHRKL